MSWNRSIVVLTALTALLPASAGAAPAAAPSAATFRLPNRVGLADPMTPGTDGSMWVAVDTDSGNTGTLVKLVSSGIKRTISTKGGSIASMTLTSDGSLWFGSDGSTNVGRVSPAGKVSYYGTGLKSPTTSIYYGTVAPAPGGGVWYDGGDGRLVEFGLSGKVVRRLSVGVQAALLGAGAQGAPIWIAESSNKVTTIAPSGKTLHTFSLAGLPTDSESIYAVGPDGSLWFSYFTGGNGLGRLLPSGKSVPQVAKGLLQVLSIAFDPGGSPWWLNYADVNDKSGAVDHLNAAGTVDSFGESTGAQQVAFDSRGGFWTTDGLTSVSYSPEPPSTPCLVPSVYGLSQDAATAAIQKSGTCALGAVNGSGTTVWGQSPLPGAYVDKGTAVSILLGTGPAVLTGSWEGDVTTTDTCYSDGTTSNDGPDHRTLTITASAGGGFDAVFAGSSGVGLGVTSYHSSTQKGATTTFTSSSPAYSLQLMLSDPRGKPTLDLLLVHKTKNECSFMNSDGELYRTAAP